MTPLDELYAELDEVQRMSEEAVMRKYNADCKDDIIRLILDDIENLEYPPYSAASSDDADEDIEEERIRICRLQGLTRYC